jgi:serine/threonine-protein kinase
VGGAHDDARERPALFASIRDDRRRHAVAAIIAVAGALTLLVSVTSARRAQRIAGSGPSESPGTTATAPTATGTAIAVPTGQPGSAPSAEPAAPPVAATWTASVAPKAAPAIAPARVAPRRPSGTSGVVAAVHPGCDVDFELDSQGRKHFKPECVSGAQTSPGTAASPKADCDPNYDLDAQGRKHFKAQCFLNASH